MGKKIGVMVGREWSFPPAFIEEVNGRQGDIVAEYVKLATPSLQDPIGYSVILDRISHEVPFYRAYLEHAAAHGVRVVNDPSTWLQSDRFNLTARAAALGIQVPRTIVLPHREYAEGIVHEESLRNLDYPLDWGAVVAHVGLPCVLRDARGNGDPTHVCHSEEELLRYYNESGQRLIIVQELIPWQQFVRCFVVGGTDVLPLKYDPGERRYQVHHAHLSAELGQRIVDDSLRVARGFGLDVTSIDWAINDGVPYAVELLNPVPEIDIYALTDEYFDWVVQRIADHAIRLVDAPDSARYRPLRAAGEGSRDLAEDLPSLARGLPGTRL